ncbi:uncharacterized protein LOC130676101 [Microplitis mediator]|uniref:uncharacterized protein LOC130676101 n=1 Tax=Microplitis mediator TaxID=375433 RepID=UPI00255527C8|nr:uncharacterized protein LOC130676101 [Microplitis mediator]
MNKIHMKRKCCVIGCISNCQNMAVKYYCFPGRTWEHERKSIWIANTQENMNQDKLWKPTKNSRICSLHFEGGEKSNDPRKLSYNPTIFPWGKSNSVYCTSGKPLLSPSKEMNMSMENFSKQTNEIEVQTDFPSDYSSDDFCEISCWHDSLKNIVSTQISIRKKKNSEQSTQTSEDTVRNDHDHNFHFKNNVGFLRLEDIKDNGMMKQFGGTTSSFFENLLDDIKVNNTNHKFIKKVTNENRLLLFLMKVKLGLNFNALGCIFKISNVCASTIFHNILEALNLTAKKLIKWPNKETMKQNMSPVFYQHPNCRVVIDFLEYRLYTTPSVEQRALRHSSFKGYFVVKFLIGIGINGEIIFISQSYDIQASNCYIVEDCGILNLLETGDEIITLKELHELRSRENLKKIEFKFIPVKCNYLTNMSKKNNDRNTELIIKYIDRIFTKLKQFHIMDHLNTKLFPDINKIMSIVCLLANKME